MTGPFMIGIACPTCGSVQSRTLETRKGEGETRRRRECHKCQERFWTAEKVENAT